jgi:adenylate cyclase
VPFVNDRVRANLASGYMQGPEHKAFALNTIGVPGFVVGQPSEEAARSAALEMCQKRAENTPSRLRCEVYAVGDRVVYPHGRPPMPPQPWIRRDPSTERPFAVNEVPLIRDVGKAKLESTFPQSHKPRTLAIGPGGQFTFITNSETVEESARRSLESCAAAARVPCMIVAADDDFVVPVPTLMKVTGFFHAASNSSILFDAREDVARKLAEASNGWSAVAVGTQGRPGVGVKEASEQNALNEALANCAKRDTDCHVIAIGPFTVGPN